MKSFLLQAAVGLIAALIFFAAMVFNDAPLPCQNNRGECVENTNDESCWEYCVGHNHPQDWWEKK